MNLADHLHYLPKTGTAPIDKVEVFIQDILNRMPFQQQYLIEKGKRLLPGEFLIQIAVELAALVPDLGYQQIPQLLQTTSPNSIIYHPFIGIELRCYWMLIGL